MERITLDKIKADENIRALIDGANNNLKEMGYTEHGLRHVGYVSRTTANILRELGYDERTAELGAITGWMHDIGNAVNRQNHGLTGATLAFQLLDNMGMDMREIAVVIGAIGNHEEETGVPVSAVSAALIIADKTDVRRNRVRQKEMASFDIHDRVNYAVTEAKLKVNEEKKVITLNLKIDENICSMLEYFEIFLKRMLMCRRACEMLGAKFKMTANGSKIV